MRRRSPVSTASWCAPHQWSAAHPGGGVHWRLRSRVGSGSSAGGVIGHRRRGSAAPGAAAPRPDRGCHVAPRERSPSHPSRRRSWDCSARPARMSKARSPRCKVSAHDSARMQRSNALHHGCSMQSDVHSMGVGMQRCRAASTSLPVRAAPPPHLCTTLPCTRAQGRKGRRGHADSSLPIACNPAQPVVVSHGGVQVPWQGQTDSGNR